jgi:hypothetical protein
MDADTCRVHCVCRTALCQWQILCITFAQVHLVRTKVIFGRPALRFLGVVGSDVRRYGQSLCMRCT